MSVVLASGSETRAAMLRAAGVEIEVVPSGVDESAIKADFDGTPLELAETLALAKASEVSARMPGRLVLGADQVLVFDGGIHDKPGSFAEARRQMRTLRGETHGLVSAAALLRDGSALWSGHGTAELTMRHFSDAFLDRYLAEESEAVLRSVGGYRIEGLGAQLFERVEGDRFAILGLPLLEVLAALRDEGEMRR